MRAQRYGNRLIRVVVIQDNLVLVIGNLVEEGCQYPPFWRNSSALLPPVLLFLVFEFVAIFWQFIFNTANEFTGLLFDAIALCLTFVVDNSEDQEDRAIPPDTICKRNWTEGSLSQAWLGFSCSKSDGR